MLQFVYLRADQRDKFQAIQFDVQRECVIGEVDVVAHTTRVQVVEWSHLRWQTLFVPIVQVEHRKVVVDQRAVDERPSQTCQVHVQLVVCCLKENK
jgi:hypothetical protein